MNRRPCEGRGRWRHGTEIDETSLYLHHDEQADGDFIRWSNRRPANADLSTSIWNGIRFLQEMGFDAACPCRTLRSDRRSHRPRKGPEKMEAHLETAPDFQSQPQLRRLVRSHQQLSHAASGPRLRGGDVQLRRPPATSACNPCIRRAAAASKSCRSRCGAVRRQRRPRRAATIWRPCPSDSQ